MEKKPYSKVNRAVGIPFALAISAAAFDQFVALADTPAHRQLVKAIRWGNILAALTTLHPPSDLDEFVFEVNVVEPEGILRVKAIKVVTGLTDDGRGAFTFMLPEEMDPAAPSLGPHSL